MTPEQTAAMKEYHKQLDDEEYGKPQTIETQSTDIALKIPVSGSHNLEQLKKIAERITVKDERGLEWRVDLSETWKNYPSDINCITYHNPDAAPAHIKQIKDTLSSQNYQTQQYRNILSWWMFTTSLSLILLNVVLICDVYSNMRIIKEIRQPQPTTQTAQK